MKLRNKNTGRIVNFRQIAFDEPKDDREKYRYSSLAEFNDEWEDVPKEPLIKDKKIRDIIRTWAEVNGATGATELRYHDDENCLVDIFRNEIHFNQLLGLEDDKTYTVTELCGEEVE